MIRSGLILMIVLLYYTFLAFSTVEFVVYTFGMKIFPCRVSASILSDCGQEVLCLHRVHRPQARCHAYIEIFPVRFSSSPPQRAVGMQKKTTVHSFCISVQKEVCATHLRRLPFAFSEQA